MPQPGADDRVVVDDQHADAHETGTSATSVVPASRRDSTCSLPSSSADALAHALEPEAAVAGRRRVEALAVVLDHRRDRARLPRRARC